MYRESPVSLNDGSIPDGYKEQMWMDLFHRMGIKAVDGKSPSIFLSPYFYEKEMRVKKNFSLGKFVSQRRNEVNNDEKQHK